MHSQGAALVAWGDFQQSQVSLISDDGCKSQLPVVRTELPRIATSRHADQFLLQEDVPQSKLSIPTPTAKEVTFVIECQHDWLASVALEHSQLLRAHRVPNIDVQIKTSSRQDLSVGMPIQTPYQFWMLQRRRDLARLRVTNFDPPVLVIR